FGDLVRLDTVGNESAYESAKSRISLQDELWAHLKRAAAAPGGSGDISELMQEYGGSSGSSSSSGYPGMTGYPGMDSGPSNPKRRSSLKRNSPMMMMESSGP
ncbi:MAG: hypothetical protein HQ518_29045, partial [Rhodopirellula sp.]|nr:hypothetical protein [Rhodopirellula sp.]